MIIKLNYGYSQSVSQSVKETFRKIAYSRLLVLFWMIDWCYCNNPCFQLWLHLCFVFARVRSINVTEGNFDGSMSSHPCSSIFSQSQCSMMNFCKTHAGNAIIDCDKELSHFSTTANDISMSIDILRKLWILDKRLCNLYRLSYIA